MTDKVQKIKEFLIGMASAACCDAKTKKNIETIILPFVDSLQEEPVSEQKLSNVERIGKNLKEESGLNWEDMSLQEKKDLLASLQKDIEPASEDLDLGCGVIWKGEEPELLGADDLPSEDSVSEDLEEKAKRYATEGDEISGLYIIDEEVEAFKAGANWQKQQMMKKAFPVEIGRQRSDYKCVLHGNFSNCDTGDKVKVIIIKED